MISKRSLTRKSLLRLTFGIACVAVAAAAGREAGRVLMFVLLVLFWVALIVLERQEQARGSTLGMRLPIRLFGLCLLLFLALLLFGP